MPKMLQVRQVPDDVHAALRSKAAHAGMSLSEYVLRELRVVAEEPTLEEVLDDAAVNAHGDFATVDLLDAIDRERTRR